MEAHNQPSEDPTKTSTERHEDINGNYVRVKARPTSGYGRALPPHKPYPANYLHDQTRGSTSDLHQHDCSKGTHFHVAGFVTGDVEHRFQTRTTRTCIEQASLSSAPDRVGFPARSEGARPKYAQHYRTQGPACGEVTAHIHSKSDTVSAKGVKLGLPCTTGVAKSRSTGKAAASVTRRKHQTKNTRDTPVGTFPEEEAILMSERKHSIVCADGLVGSKDSISSSQSTHEPADATTRTDSKHQDPFDTTNIKQPKPHTTDITERTHTTQETAQSRMFIPCAADVTELKYPTSTTTSIKKNNSYSTVVTGRAEYAHLEPNPTRNNHTTQDVADSTTKKDCKPITASTIGSEHTKQEKESETINKASESHRQQSKGTKLDKHDGDCDNRNTVSDQGRPQTAHASDRPSLSHQTPRKIKRRHKKKSGPQDSSSDRQAENMPTDSDKEHKEKNGKHESDLGIQADSKPTDADTEDKRKNAIDADNFSNRTKKGKYEALKTETKKLDSADGFGHEGSAVRKEQLISKDQVGEGATYSSGNDIQRNVGSDTGDKDVSNKDTSKNGKDVDVNAQKLSMETTKGMTKEDSSTRERTKQGTDAKKSLPSKPRNFPNDRDIATQAEEIETAEGVHTSIRGTPTKHGEDNSSTQEGICARHKYPITGHTSVKSSASDYHPSKSVVTSEEKRTFSQNKTETLPQQKDILSKAQLAGAVSKKTQQAAPDVCTNATSKQSNVKVKAEPEDIAYVVQQNFVKTDVRQHDKRQTDQAEIWKPESQYTDLAHSAQRKDQHQHNLQSETRAPSQSRNQSSNTEKVIPELPLPKEKPEVVQGTQQEVKASTANNGQKDVVQVKSKQPTEDTSSEKSRGSVSKGIPLSHSTSEQKTGRQDNAASEKASSSKEHRQSQHQRNQASSQQPAATTSKKAVKPNKANDKTPSPKQALERKIRDFMLQHFPRLHDWTYIVPPITFNVAKRTPDARFHGCFRSELTPQSNVRADEAKERTLKCLQELSQHKTLFIMSGVIFDEYLNQRPSESSERPGEKVQMPFPKPTDLPPQYRRGEIDVMIIDKSHGIIILDVKAIGDTFNEMSLNESQILDLIRKVLEKVLLLIRKEREVILHLVSDIPCTIPVSAMLILPNLSRSLLKKTLDSFPDMRKELTTSLKTKRPVDEVCVCAEDLPAKHQAMTDDEARHFVQCWVQQFSERPQIIDDVIYEQIIGRFCGPFSSVTVWTAEPTRTDVRTLGKAVSETGRRFSTAVLLPQHIEVLDSDDKNVYISGIPGAGKTLVLTLKGLHWAKSGFYVCVLTAKAGQSAVALIVRERIQHALDFEVDKRGQGVIDTDSIIKDNNDLQINCKYLVKCLTQRADGRPICLLLDEIHGELQPAIHNITCQLPRHSRFWCTGRWDTACPQGFVQKQLKTSIRCPPAVQVVLQLSEPSLNMSMTSPTQFTYVTNSTQIVERPLPTTGVRPKLMSHAWPGTSILQCRLCGEKLAAYLKEQLRIGADLFQHDILILTADTRTLTTTHNMFSFGFVDALCKEGLEVNIISNCYHRTRELAFPAENKMTLTSYKFVSGLERKVVVFLPEGTPPADGTKRDPNLSKVSCDTDSDTDDECTTLDPVRTSLFVGNSSPQTRVETTLLGDKQIHNIVHGSLSSASDVMITDDDANEQENTQDKWMLQSKMTDRHVPDYNSEDFYRLRDDLIIHVENISDDEEEDVEERSYDSRLREAVSQLSETNRERLWFAASRAVAHVVVFHFSDN